ncbi:MAG: hypothetical protein K0R87_3274, partial [Pseudonocardia sp.]|nr:hypothetical protein [Pseudonocardia sp.]
QRVDPGQLLRQPQHLVSTWSGSTASHKLTSGARVRSISPRLPSSQPCREILPRIQPPTEQARRDVPQVKAQTCSYFFSSK